MRKYGRWLLAAGLLAAPGLLWAADAVSKAVGCCGGLCPFAK